MSLLQEAAFEAQIVNQAILYLYKPGIAKLRPQGQVAPINLLSL